MNAINVFPVADSDTGANLAATMAAEAGLAAGFLIEIFIDNVQ